MNSRPHYDLHKHQSLNSVKQEHKGGSELPVALSGSGVGSAPFRDARGSRSEAASSAWSTRHLPKWKSGLRTDPHDGGVTNGKEKLVPVKGIRTTGNQSSALDKSLEEQDALASQGCEPTRR